MTNFHSFHLVNLSPWPLINSFNLMSMMFNLMKLIKFPCSMNFMIFLINLMILLTTLLTWMRDITREASFQGYHTKNVTKGLKLGVILFILSEIMFFISFFWSMYHFSLAPELEIGNSWPPLGINPFNPYQIPLLNSIILISSGVTITWCHHSIMNKNYINSVNSLVLTILLGAIFTIFQLIEYNSSLFSINDSSYGTIFFLSTGFHGFHVLLGTSFLIVNIMRMNNSHFNKNHHFGFEAAAWYWHFVDVVWIYLYTMLYWWFWY